ncbi:MAG: TRAP transporter small permease [Rhodobacteraceae bacterium]|nr:TRAP transporter small permease [Paracoccaceae bacterium]MBR9821026.1 TRAP transporter small permease [Paracoccaceae bacterium]
MTAFIQRLSTGFTYVAGASVLFMMGVTLADIGTRTLLGFSIIGTYDLIQLGLVLAVYGGMSEAFRRNAHIAVDLLDAIASPRLLRISALLTLVLAAVFVGLLTWLGVAAAQETRLFGDVTMDLRIPKVWHWAAIILCLGMTCLSLLDLLLQALARRGATEDPQ